MTKKIGILYVVATPIGNLDDMSFRAVRILSEVDLIAAEDTRHSKGLLDHFGIHTPLTSLHEHNETHRAEILITKLQEGLRIALISDAGTPLISDPGYRLVQQTRDARISVVPIPGPSALITALCVSGLPTDRFLFEGFLPAKSSQRVKQLQLLSHETRTMIFYEAPHRVLACVDDFIEVFGGDRPGVIARELTKTFESIYSGTLHELKEILLSSPEKIKGEFVMLVKGNELSMNEKDFSQTQRVLEMLLAELPVKQAVQLAASITGENKNLLYKTAIKSKHDQEPRA